MRTWFWTLLLAVVAVALAVVLRAHAGNVLLLVWPWRIELSLTLTVLLLVAAFVTLYVGLRLLAWLVAIPDRLRAWRGRRAQERDHELLERGWIGLLEGRFAQAEKDLSKLFDQTKVRSSRVLAALSGARAAHNLGEYERRDRMLESAREQAGEDAGLQEATATVSADMLLDQGRAQQALDLLEPLQDGGARHLHTMR
ncbi:protoheme IX synthesis protein, partial [Bordetella pertussis]